MGMDLHNSSHRFDGDDCVLPQLADLLIKRLKIFQSHFKQFLAGGVNLPLIH